MLAPKDELENVIEAILFVAGQGVEIAEISEKLEVPADRIKKAIEKLKEKHASDGINIITYKNSVQLCSKPDYAEDIASVLNPIREKQLTKAALETAAIIAYKQPVTRLDIEQIRGVNSDYALQVLMNFKLVEVVGRKDAVGKPLLFGTTDEFLKRFELENINDLPDYEELLERIEVLHQEFNDGLYRSTEIIPEEDLPDSESKQQEIASDAIDDTAEKAPADTQKEAKQETADMLGTTLEDAPILGEEYEETDLKDSSLDNFDDDSDDIIDSKDEDWL